MIVDLQPTKCNICGGVVKFVSNTRVYRGRQYGNGVCYLCMDCGAYVGTHKHTPHLALGILSDRQMRAKKIKCHELFDKHWRCGSVSRSKMYDWLAKELKIDRKDCHFGYFDMRMLSRAYNLLKSIKDCEPVLGNNGNIKKWIKV